MVPFFSKILSDEDLNDPLKRRLHNDWSYQVVLYRYRLGGHLKTGQSGSPQNRPVERAQDSHSFTLPVTLSARVFRIESSIGAQLG